MFIVNADDFGKSEEVNRAICECFEKGYINRTTLMVNMPFATQAVELAKEKGFFDKVGLHINLTDGMPLSEKIRNNPLICDKNGRFHAAFAKSKKYRLYMDEQSVNQFMEEIEEQIKRYEEYGLTLWHIDSHHHVHTNYPVFRALKKLSRKYHFSSIRISRNMYNKGSLFNNTYKMLYNHGIKKLCDESSELFGSYLDYKEYSGKLPASDNKVEIMVHPEFDKEGRLIDSTNENYILFEDFNY